MRDGAFQDWQRERDAVEQEMDHLIAAGMPNSVEERQVRRTRFAALIERREAAARNLLQSDRRRDWSPRAPSRPGDHLVSAAHLGAAAEGEQTGFVSLPDGRENAEAQSELSTPAAAVPASSVPAEAAELPDVAAHAPDAAGLVPESTELPADIAELAPAPSLLAESAALPVTDPAGALVPAPSADAAANAPDAVPLAADAEAPSALSSADLHSAAAPLAPDPCRGRWRRRSRRCCRIPR